MCEKRNLANLIMACVVLGSLSSCFGAPVPPCEADPDPCCEDSSSQLCSRYTACQAAGGRLESTGLLDGGETCNLGVSAAASTSGGGSTLGGIGTGSSSAGGVSLGGSTSGGSASAGSSSGHP